MTEKDELFFQSVVDAYHACHESLRDTAKAMQLSRMNITVQMYPCSEGTDTDSPAL